MYKIFLWKYIKKIPKIPLHRILNQMWNLVPLHEMAFAVSENCHKRLKVLLTQTLICPLLRTYKSGWWNLWFHIIICIIFTWQNFYKCLHFIWFWQELFRLPFTPDLEIFIRIFDVNNNIYANKIQKNKHSCVLLFLLLRGYEK